jgi:hypothetical protein
MLRIGLLALAVWVGLAEDANAGWKHWGSAPNPTPGYVPGAAGRKSWAGIPGLGDPIPPSRTRPGTSPVIGSVSRTGHFVHPVSGRTRYTGLAYDPVLGRFEKYHFRQ